MIGGESLQEKIFRVAISYSSGLQLHHSAAGVVECRSTRVIKLNKGDSGKNFSTGLGQAAGSGGRSSGAANLHG